MYSDNVEKFKHYDTTLRELKAKCRQIQIKRAKYHDKLVQIDERTLAEHGLCKSTRRSFQPLTQRYVSNYLSDYFNNKKTAEICMRHLLARRKIQEISHVTLIP